MRSTQGSGLPEGEPVSTNLALAVGPAALAALATAGGVALKGSLDRRAESRRTTREDRQRFFDALLRAAAEAFAMCDVMTRKVDADPRLHFGSPEMYEESVRFHAAFAALHLLGDEAVVQAANGLHDLFDIRGADGRIGYLRLERSLRTLRNAVRENLDIDRAFAQEQHRARAISTAERTGSAARLLSRVRLPRQRQQRTEPPPTRWRDDTEA